MGVVRILGSVVALSSSALLYMATTRGDLFPGRDCQIQLGPLGAKLQAALLSPETSWALLALAYG
eukprot:g12561.t1